MDEAILLNREALELQPTSHPDRHNSLNNLAIDLHSRFDKTGQLADLEEAILLNREALGLRPPSHPDRPNSLDHLALILARNYDKTGQLADLEEAILLNREALGLQHPSDPNRPVSLDILAICLDSRCRESTRFTQRISDTTTPQHLPEHSIHPSVPRAPNPGTPPLRYHAGILNGLPSFTLHCRDYTRTSINKVWMYLHPHRGPCTGDPASSPATHTPERHTACRDRPMPLLLALFTVLTYV